MINNVFNMIAFAKPHAADRRVVILRESMAENLLLEVMSLSDVHDKYYPDVDNDTFKTIVSSDPTSGPDKMGVYSKWLLRLYKNGSMPTEDLYKATEYLSVFDRYKQKLQHNDIGRYRSLPELYNAVKPFMDDPGQAATKGEEIRRIKNEGAEKFYEDSKWLVIIPKTEEAAVYYGKGTQWCTAASESDNYFDYYNNHGKLYINIDKRNNEKYQFHFETQQFMDASDDFIEQPIGWNISLSDELVKKYTAIYGIKALPLFSNYDQDEIVPLSNNICAVSDIEGVLFKLDFDACELKTIYKAPDDACRISDIPIYDRFLKIYRLDGWESLNIDLFDLHEEKPVFGNDSGIESFVVLGKHLAVKFNDGRAAIFSLDTMSFTKEVDADLWFWPLTSDYDNNFVIATNTKTKMTTPFSIKDGRPLTDFIYNSVGMVEMGVNGKMKKFITFLKGDDNYNDADIILYDGTIMPLPKVAQCGDEIFAKHLNETATEKRASIKESVEEGGPITATGAQRFKTVGIGDFDRSKFVTPRQHSYPHRNKPEGGMWASPVGDGYYTWEKWCDEENFKPHNNDTSFEFTLKPGSRVLRIDSKDDAEHIPMAWDRPENKGNDLQQAAKSMGEWLPDFEELSRRYDAVMFFCSGLRNQLYGWDCDSLLVLNPDCVQVASNESRIRCIVTETVEEAWKGIEDVTDRDELTRAAIRNGFKYTAYHNTANKDLTFFDVRSSGIHLGSARAADERGEDRGDINSYTKKFFLKMENPYVIERDFDWERTGASQACGDDDDYEDWRREYEAEYYMEHHGFKYAETDENGEITNFYTLSEMLAQQGYDCIVYKNQEEDAGSYSVAMFNPNHIKSADLTTYDDNGSPIPIEDRFDTSTDDVRY